MGMVLKHGSFLDRGLYVLTVQLFAAEGIQTLLVIDAMFTIRTVYTQSLFVVFCNEHLCDNHLFCEFSSI